MRKRGVKSTSFIYTDILNMQDQGETVVWTKGQQALFIFKSVFGREDMLTTFSTELPGRESLEANFTKLPKLCNYTVLSCTQAQIILLPIQCEKSCREMVEMFCYY